MEIIDEFRFGPIHTFNISVHIQSLMYITLFQQHVKTDLFLLFTEDCLFLARGEVILHQRFFQKDLIVSVYVSFEDLQLPSNSFDFCFA